MRRLVALAVVGGLLGLVPPVAARAATSSPACTGTPRLMIVSAYPAEMGKIMKATKLDSVEPVRSAAPDSKEYWTGTLEGKAVIEALVGIGPVDATHTTADAFDVFGGCITGIVFSGVAGAGSDSLGPGGTRRSSRIGDVTVPDGWNNGLGRSSGEHHASRRPSLPVRRPGHHPGPHVPLHPDRPPARGRRDDRPVRGPARPVPAAWWGSRRLRAVPGGTRYVPGPAAFCHGHLEPGVRSRAGYRECGVGRIGIRPVHRGRRRDGRGRGGGQLSPGAVHRFPGDLRRIARPVDAARLPRSIRGV